MCNQKELNYPGFSSNFDLGALDTLVDPNSPLQSPKDAKQPLFFVPLTVHPLARSTVGNTAVAIWIYIMPSAVTEGILKP